MDSVDGSPLPSGAHTDHRAMPLTYVETWRSSTGNAADDRETLTGRGVTHGTKPCGAGMPARLDVAHGGGIARTAGSCRRCCRRSV